MIVRSLSMGPDMNRSRTCFVRLTSAALSVLASVLILSSCGEVDEPLGGDNPPEEELRAVGLSAFALHSPRFDCNRYLSAVSELQEIHLTTLAGSFGRAYGCLGRISMTGKLKSWQVHLVNETCFEGRSDNCYEPQEIFRGSREKYAELINAGPNSAEAGWLYDRIHNLLADVVSAVNELGIETCYISPGLESNLPKESMDVLMRFVRSVVDHQLETPCKLVFNPVNDIGPNDEADLYEHHRGSFPTMAVNRPAFPVICNNDGTHIEHGTFVQYPRVMSLADAESFLRDSTRCEVTYLWAADVSNCIEDYSNIEVPYLRSCPKLVNVRNLLELLKNAEN